MVLSKIPEQPTGKGSTSEVVSFLREFKPLECSCCSQLMGFQHRVTGVLFCTPGCNDGKHDVVDNRSCSSAPTLTTFVKKPENEANVNPVYRNIPIKSEENVKGGKIAAQQDDLKKQEAPSPKILNDESSSVSGTILPRCQEKSESEVANSANIRKTTVNPFFKNMPSTKPGSEGKTKDQILDEDLGITQAEEEARKLIPGAKLVEKVEDITDSSKPLPERIPLPRHKPKFETDFEQKPTAVVAAATAEVPEPKRFMWQTCKFSEELIDGAMVKTSFLWNINKLQIVADKDEKALDKYQRKIAQYVAQAMPMNRKPIIDEMVLAEYSQEYYRGRVVGIAGDACHVIFVDFGDERHDCHYTHIFEVNEDLMSYPIYSACVVLDGVRKLEKKVKPGRKLNEILYGAMQLQMTDKIVMDGSETFRVLLWLSDEKHLNEVVREVVSQLDENPNTPGTNKFDFEYDDGYNEGPPIPEFKSLPKPEYIPDDKLYEFLFNRTSPYSKKNETACCDVAETEEDAQLSKQAETESSTVEIDAQTHHYTTRDTFLPKTSKQFTVRGCNAKGLDSIYVATIGPEDDAARELISHEIENLIEDGQLKQKPYTEIPTGSNMFVVKWCSWEELYLFLSRMKMTAFHKSLAGPKFDEPYYAPMKQANNKLEGQWFRAFFRNRVSGDMEKNEVDCGWYCLIDIGTTIAVPNKYVYHINEFLMTPNIYTFGIRLVLNEVVQYCSHFHDACKRLFDRTPNMELTVKTVGRFSRKLDVILIQPTEEEFLQKLTKFWKQEQEHDIASLRDEFQQSEKFINNVTTTDMFENVLNAIKQSFENKAKQKGSIWETELRPFCGQQQIVKLGGYYDIKRDDD